MLEHYEIVELENKWKEYKAKEEKEKKFANVIKDKVLKLDRTILILLSIIFFAVIAIAWILFYHSSSSYINSEAVIANNKIVDTNSTATDSNLTDLAKTDTSLANTHTLTLNDISIKNSEDGGGFVLNNSYESQRQVYIQDVYSNPWQQSPIQTQNQARRNFNSAGNMRDELIDFGNAPNPPRKTVSGGRQITQQQPKARIVIETKPISKADADEQDAKKDIKKALSRSEDAYNSGNYEDAINWALISNEIDKNNKKSWVIFAKSNYKIGKVQDAIISLEAFDKKNPSKEIKDLIKQFKAGTFK